MRVTEPLQLRGAVISFMANESPQVQTHRRWLLASAFLYSILLILTITARSLSTDEAFSAYIADQKTFGLLLSTLGSGDSSDLQMAMHYFYMHCWTLVFGSGELALRAANIPFILPFAFALVWASWRVFRARWVWIGAALFALLWLYASEARAYMALIGLSTLCVACLLAYLKNPSPNERRWLPWIVLGSLLLGATFHMLMLLLAFPLCVLVFFCWRSTRDVLRWADWKPALQVSLVAYALLFAYLAWTFLRGTAYDYQRPSILSMGSVLYRFLGLFGYGPNRHYEIPFRPFLPSLLIATSIFLVALGGTFVAGLRGAKRPLVISLFAACGASIFEILIISLVARQQIEVRHLAALTPLVLFLIVGCLSEQPGRPASRLAVVSTILLTGVWLIAAGRLLFLPENQWENFRAAVDKAVTLQRASNAAVALVADPAAGAYYGLDLTGKKPCFPLADDCSTGFSKVAWDRKAPAVYAAFWTAPQISSWFATQERNKTPVVVIISRARHPMYQGSPWWTTLNSRKSQLYTMHGFFVYFFKN